MTIQVNFESFDEMVGFAKRLAGGSSVKTVVTKPEPVKAEAPAAGEEKVYSMEDVRKKLLELNKAGKKDKVAELIKSFGVDKFPQVPPEKYGELMAKAEAL